MKILPVYIQAPFSVSAKHHTALHGCIWYRDWTLPKVLALFIPEAECCDPTTPVTRAASSAADVRDLLPKIFDFWTIRLIERFHEVVEYDAEDFAPHLRFFSELWQALRVSYRIS